MFWVGLRYNRSGHLQVFGGRLNSLNDSFPPISGSVVDAHTDSQRRQPSTVAMHSVPIPEPDPPPLDPMKLTPLLSRLAVPGVFALLVSCLTTAPNGPYLERDPEVLGQRTGREDALAGRDSDFERHLRELHPSADVDDFEDAYDDAYEAAEDALDDHRDRDHDDGTSSHGYASGQAYGSGYAMGELDRSRGQSRSAYRHEGASSGSSSIQASWVAGYEDGWNGVRR